MLSVSNKSSFFREAAVSGFPGVVYTLIHRFNGDAFVIRVITRLFNDDNHLSDNVFLS